MNLIPTFDWNTVVIAPWFENTEITTIVILMGFFVSACCGLIGVFLILRKISLTGDAISHSLLGGIAVAYVISASRDSLILFFGALAAGLTAVVGIEYIPQKSKIKSDAAIGIVFTTLFSLGVFIISYYSSHIDLDAECVLYGELGLIPFEQTLSIMGVNIGPKPLIIMLLSLISVATLIYFFYKELLTSTFDSAYARTQGINTTLFHYGLLITLSIILVNAFRSVGAILAVGMLLFPGCTSMLFFNNIKVILVSSILLSAIYSVFGLHTAVYLNCSIAAAMCSVAFGIFLVSFVIKLIKTS